MTWNEAARRLTFWAADPDSIADVEVIPPTPDALVAARQFVRANAYYEGPSPRRCVPDGDGGILIDLGGSEVQFDSQGVGTQRDVIA